MSGMTSKRLAEIRGRQDSRRRQAEVANVHAITLGPSHLWSAMQDGDDLLAHVDHLTAENARLREGIEALAESVEGSDHTPGCGGEPTCAACWAADLDSLLHPNALLSTPTEGEPDA